MTGAPSRTASSRAARGGSTAERGVARRLAVALAAASLAVGASLASAADASVSAVDDRSTTIDERSPDEPPASPTACAHDPDSGRPNPLGPRAFVRVHRAGEDSVFVYERLPALLADAAEPATIAVRRTLRAYGMTVPEARAWLRLRDAAFEELLGFRLEGGYAALDELFACR